MYFYIKKYTHIKNCALFYNSSRVYTKINAHYFKIDLSITPFKILNQSLYTVTKMYDSLKTHLKKK